MQRVVLYIAMSLDGYIARTNGDVDWLGGDDPSVPEDELMSGCARFYETVDSLIMGRATYDQVLGFGKWPYAGKPCYVLTHRSAAPDPNVELVAGDAKDVLARVSQTSPGVIWLVGGSDVARRFAVAGLIDEYRVTIIPTVLGSGISLFPEGFPETRLRLSGTETLAGTVELQYVQR